MSEDRSDALVFFGATGDLAYKKIFPSLQGMLKRGHLDVPVIGVAKAGWTLDQFRARAHDSLKKHGGVDPAAFEKLVALLRYVDGYADPATFVALREELAGAQGRRITWRSRRDFSARSSSNWPRPDARPARVSSSKSGSDMISAQPAN